MEGEIETQGDYVMWTRSLSRAKKESHSELSDPGQVFQVFWSVQRVFLGPSRLLQVITNPLPLYLPPGIDSHLLLYQILFLVSDKNSVQVVKFKETERFVWASLQFWGGWCYTTCNFTCWHNNFLYRHLFHSFKPPLLETKARARLFFILLLSMMMTCSSSDVLLAILTKGILIVPVSPHGKTVGKCLGKWRGEAETDSSFRLAPASTWLACPSLR